MLASPMSCDIVVSEEVSLATSILVVVGNVVTDVSYSYVIVKLSMVSVVVMGVVVSVDSKMSWVITSGGCDVGGRVVVIGSGVVIGSSEEKHRKSSIT